MTVVIERHAVLLPAVKVLQHIHVVGHCDVAFRVGGDVVVPGSPCTTAFRQRSRIGMQHRLVVLVGDGAEHIALHRRRVVQQREGLVTVAGKKYRVIPLTIVTLRNNLDTRCMPYNGLNGRLEPDPVAVSRDQLADVLPRSALDHAPDRPVL